MFTYSLKLYLFLSISLCLYWLLFEIKIQINTENNQYDPSASTAANGIEDGDEFGSLGAPGNGPPGSGPPPSWSSGPNAPPVGSGSGPPIPERAGVASAGNNGHNGPPSQDDNKKQSPNISQWNDLNKRIHSFLNIYILYKYYSNAIPF